MPLVGIGPCQLLDVTSERLRHQVSEVLGQSAEMRRCAARLDERPPLAGRFGNRTHHFTRGWGRHLDNRDPPVGHPPPVRDEGAARVGEGYPHAEHPLHG